MSESFRACLSSIDEVIEDARNGRMFILVDDEGRENEGDLVVPAQMATPDAINFMARHGRGLICLSLTRERADFLGLAPMAARNEAQHGTAFTVSIEAREGVTTGISAADRAQTISVAIGRNRSRADLVSPGHVFPLVAQDGGVLMRAGHTEAAVDVSRLAGLDPSGVICEIMNDDGTMARMPDLIEFAREHRLKIATIADLIAYRRRTEKLVEVIAETAIDSRYGGEFKVKVYANRVAYAEHIALIRGTIDPAKPTLVRVHQHNLFADSLGDMKSNEFFRGERRPRDRDLQNSMRAIAKQGAGVVVLIREPTITTIGRVAREREGEPMSKAMDELRQYGIGAQILSDLGIRELILLTNSAHRMIGLEGYGITIVEQRAIPDLYE